MIADFAIHSPETNGIANPHVHMMCPIRPIDENGEWGNKLKRVYELDRNGKRATDHNGNYIYSAVPTTDWGKTETLEHWRSERARMCNEKFEEKQLADRIDYRSYERMRRVVVPTVSRYSSDINLTEHYKSRSCKKRKFFCSFFVFCLFYMRLPELHSRILQIFTYILILRTVRFIMVIYRIRNYCCFRVIG